jgi:hypothetical protein
MGKKEPEKMNTVYYFIFKMVLAGLIVAFTSWLAGRQSLLAGFIIALPVISMISLIFTYAETRDMARVNQYAVSILAAVPLSLLFFLPFVLNRWLNWNFVPTFGAGLALLFAAFLIHRQIFHY